LTNGLYKYALHLADNAHVLGHRNSEWTGHGPILEQDIALSNIALDLIGQARNFYQLASSMKNDGSTEDDLAYLRGPSDYLNCLLVEQQNGHWGTTVMRQFLFSVYAYSLYERLQHHQSGSLAAVAEKSLKEVIYHRRWSSEWVIRLGQGTDQSHGKMQEAINQLWMYTGELYTPADYEKEFIEDGTRFEESYQEETRSVLSRAGLEIPASVVMQYGGKEGRHSGELVSMLDEMQILQRTYPNMEW
jgi:ring-1,2-phenylacetyl-CoA epoxidase subunit PaaC